MKTKLRSIIVNQQKFNYILKESYIAYKEDLPFWMTTLRVYRDNYKNTPLELVFESEDGYPSGNSITTNSENSINLHRPFFVKQMIEKGISLGWDWNTSKMQILDAIALI